MKNAKVFAVLCALALAALPPVAFAQNILTNPDFETGDLGGWTAFGLSGSSTIVVQAGDNGPSLPGNFNAFLNNQVQALGLGLKQTTAPGTAAAGEVTYSFDLKLDQADAGGVVFVEIFAEGEGLGIVGGSGLMGPLWPWQWTNYSGSFMAPANTSFLTIQFVATTGANIGSNCVLHVDNVSLEQQGVVADDASSMGAVKALFR
ncbi:MAG: hypothetical protein AB7V45_10380 [Candidatus Krumholzibacteriia bacterium]